MKLRRTIDMAQLSDLPLDCVHGFLVSRVEVGTALQDLIYMSPVSEGETRRKVNELLELGVIALDHPAVRIEIVEAAAEDAATLRPPREDALTLRPARAKRGMETRPAIKRQRER